MEVRAVQPSRHAMTTSSAAEGSDLFFAVRVMIVTRIQIEIACCPLAGLGCCDYRDSGATSIALSSLKTTFVVPPLVLYRAQRLP